MVNPANEPKGGFYILHGSYFADWNLTTNNIMRGLLATEYYGLVVFGSSTVSGTDWHLQRFALGDPMAIGMWRTINVISPLAPQWLDIMGDPTLRLPVLGPPSGLTGNDGTTVGLGWNCSADSGAQYYVYRSTNNLEGPWTNLTLQPVSNTFYYDNAAPYGPKMYQVRAAKLVTMSSGSFTNLSQGIFVNVN